MKEQLESLLVEMQEIKKVVKEQSDRIAALESRNEGYVPAFLQEQGSSDRSDENTLPKTQKKKDFETQVGIHYLSRVGMIALLLGIAFFLKYSFDNNWVGPFGRVVTGYVSGALLLVVGEWFRRKYPLWSRVFTGGGFAILYFATFAAQHFYELMTLPVTLLIMALITVFAGLVSIAYDAIIIAFFGLIGGFLTPVLIAGGSAADEPYLWLSYILLLNLSVIVLSYFKKWQVLDVIAFVFTVFYFFDVHEAIVLYPKLSFLIAYFVQFSVSTFVLLITKKEKENALSRLPKEVLIFYLIANATFLYGFFTMLIENTYVLGVIAILLTIWYGVFMKIIGQFVKKDHFAVLSVLGLALAFVGVGVGMFFDLHGSIILWALFGVGVVWAGIRAKEYVVRVYGLAILLFASCASLIELLGDISQVNALPVANPRFISGVLVLMSLFAAQYLYHLNKKVLQDQEKNTQRTLMLAGMIFALILLTGEILTFVQHEQVAQTMISLFWGVYAAGLVGAGIAAKKQYIRIFGLTLFAATVAKVLLFDLGDLEAIYRVAAFVAVGILLIFASFLYQRTQRK